MSEYHKKFTKELVKTVQQFLSNERHRALVLLLNDDTQKELLLRLEILVAENPYKKGDE